MIKLNFLFLFFAPPAPPKNALIAHVCDSHSASQENETARKGEDVSVVRGRLLFTPLRNGLISFFFLKVLAEILEKRGSISV